MPSSPFCWMMIAAGGEIRSLDELHQLLDVDVVELLPLLEHVDQRVHHLAQVVRRDGGGHADGDAGGAVDQQVGDGGGQHGRLVERVVEVAGEIDRVLVDIGQHVQRGSGQAGFGVAHGRRRIAIHRAEVALSIHQHGAHGEILRHARHGFVHRRVAVRVILAQHLADDTGGFLVGRVGAHAHVVHGVQDAPLDRLQAVAGIRQGARDDHAHGVIEVRLLHLVVDIDFSNETEFHDLSKFLNPRLSL